MNLSNFIKDGVYIASNGATFDDFDHFLIEGLMGFCGCGCPEQVINHVHDGLRHVSRLKQEVWEKKMTMGQWQEAGQKIFLNEGSEYLLYYVLDKAGLTEHGGAVPGWLSDLGEDVLKELDRLYPE